MTEDIVRKVHARVVESWEQGCPVARDAERVADIALRRWPSSARRGTKVDDHAAKVSDLAAGLIQTLEPDPTLVGPLKKDYLWLAEQIAEVIEGSSRLR
jgi:hypothetical protein